MYLLLCSTLGKDWYSSASAVAVMVKIPVLSSNEKQRQKLKLKHGLPGFQFQPVKSPIISITRHYQGVTAEYLCTECGWCRYRWSPAWTLERIMWGLVTRAQWSPQWAHHNIIIGCHQTPHLHTFVTPSNTGHLAENGLLLQKAISFSLYTEIEISYFLILSTFEEKT